MEVGEPSVQEFFVRFGPSDMAEETQEIGVSSLQGGQPFLGVSQAEADLDGPPHRVLDEVNDPIPRRGRPARLPPPPYVRGLPISLAPEFALGQQADHPRYQSHDDLWVPFGHDALISRESMRELTKEDRKLACRHSAPGVGLVT